MLILHDRPADGLADPTGGIGAEAAVRPVIVLAYRFEQPKVALLNEISKRDPVMDVSPGHAHYQAQIRFDHPELGLLPFQNQSPENRLFGRREAVALQCFQGGLSTTDRSAEHNLFFSHQQGHPRDLAQV